MSDYVSGFYPVALDAGIDPLDFWDYTILEIADLIASYNRRFNFNRKEQAVQQFKLAQMVASYVSRMFASDSEPLPELWDYYPDLFEDERRQVEEQRVKVQLELHKQRMRLFAERTRGKFTSAD